MNPERAREIWTRLQAGQDVAEDEKAEFLRTLESDEGLRAEILEDHELDGELRGLGLSQGEEDAFVQAFLDRTASEPQAERFVARVAQALSKTTPEVRRPRSRRWLRGHPSLSALPVLAAAGLVGLALVAYLASSRPNSGTAQTRPPETPSPRLEPAAEAPDPRTIQERLAALEEQERQLRARAGSGNPVEPGEDKGEELRRKAEEAFKRIAEERRLLEERLRNAPAPPAPPTATERHASRTQVAVARIERVQGEAALIAEGSTTPAAAGANWLAGQSLKTSAAAAVDLRFPDGTLVKAAAESTLVEAAGGRPGKRIFLARGALTAQVARQPDGQPFIFETPHGEALVLGTTLRLVVDPEAGSSRLDVTEGRVRLTGKTGRPVDVPAGFYAVATVGVEPALRSELSRIVSFQDGKSPSPTYAGTRDTYLFEGRASGRPLGAAPLIWVDGRTGGGTNQRVALLKWDVSAIPAGSRVLEARLEIHVQDLAGKDAYPILEARRPWSEAEATWAQAAAGVPWEQAGAQGASDRGSVILGHLAAPASGPRGIPLNEAGVALVQRWVDHSAGNFGILVADPSRLDSAAFDSRESDVADRRPKLTVTFVPSRGGRPR